MKRERKREKIIEKQESRRERAHPHLLSPHNGSHVLCNTKQSIGALDHTHTPTLEYPSFHHLHHHHHHHHHHQQQKQQNINNKKKIKKQSSILYKACTHNLTDNTVAKAVPASVSFIICHRYPDRFPSKASVGLASNDLRDLILMESNLTFDMAL